MNVLGIAYRPDGSVAARFSDTIPLEFQNKKQAEEFSKATLYYEKQFEIAPGRYDLKVAFRSAGEAFGKLETPLAIDPYNGKQFALGGVALSKQLQQASGLGIDQAMLEDRTPLVSRGIQLIPSGTNRFKKTDPASFYTEIYEPLMVGAEPPTVALQLRVLDSKTGAEKLDTGFINMASLEQTGNAVIPVGMKVPIMDLAAGAYRLEMKAMDSAGNVTQVRTVEFELE